MPVTRSQSQSKLAVSNEVKVDDEVTRWFYLIIGKYLDELKLLNPNKPRECFYDKIRVVTEMYYILRKYFPEVYLKNQHISTKFINFAKEVYKKIDEICSSIQDILLLHYDVIQDINEYNSIKNMFRELHIAEKMFVTYIKDDELRKPKRSPYVSYIGMDTIEPENEFDGITNIWFDETIEEDSDYKTEDDEDYITEEEEDDGDYIPDEDDEEEDYENDENEIFDCLLKSKNLPSLIKNKELSKSNKMDNQLWLEYIYY
jgi:hypothetical protein